MRGFFASLLGWSCCLSSVTSASAADADTLPEFRDLYSDTWVAADSLGRVLPSVVETGPPRASRTVGMFYFLWLGRHGDAGPFDISKILAEHPEAFRDPKDPRWGPMHVPHHWGESIFGYYVGDDDGVLRKHAQMLADSGVDVIVFDVTNQLTYPESYEALCRVFRELRQAGNRTPQIAFLCPFGDPRKVVRELYEHLYRPDRYPELWFRWEGKPLIMADPDRIGLAAQGETQGPAVSLDPDRTLGQSFTTDGATRSVGACAPTWRTRDSAVTLRLRREGPAGTIVCERRFTGVADNSWLLLEPEQPLAAGRYYLEMSQALGRIGWWSAAPAGGPGTQAYVDGAPVAGKRAIRLGDEADEEAQIRRFFTFRKPQPDYFTGPTGPRQWGWLEVYPQHPFYARPGVPEQMTVGVAQNAVDGKLSVLSNPRAHGRSFHEGREPDPAHQDTTGRNFTEQWQRVFEVDPPFVFITGWNEWIAGRFDATAPFYQPGPVTFVDQFSPEYSRDIEPMKGGHGDNYYYQAIANIRRYKGARPVEPISRAAVQIDGHFEDWRSVGPEFRDTVGDEVRRDYRGWGKDTRYTNRSGRNDLVVAKVAYDETHVHFYAAARRPLTPPSDPHWMLLFLNTDGNPTNGWLGYDFVLNREPGREGWASLEKHDQAGYHWTPRAEVSCRFAGNALELAVPRALLGISAEKAMIDFKWADNIQETGDWSDFTLNGDAAPNDRFNYRAILGQAKAAR